MLFDVSSDLSTKLLLLLRFLLLELALVLDLAVLSPLNFHFFELACLLLLKHPLFEVVLISRLLKDLRVTGWVHRF